MDKNNTLPFRNFFELSQSPSATRDRYQNIEEVLFSIFLINKKGVIRERFISEGGKII